MFDLETIVSAGDIDNEEKMAAHRFALDAGAKGHQSTARFQREEIVPYLIVKTDGQTLPETEETRAWRILRRSYK